MSDLATADGAADLRCGGGADGAGGTGEVVGWGCVVDLGELFLGGTGLFAGLDGSAGEEVAADELDVGEKFASFRVGEDEGEEGAEVGDRLSTILLGVVLGDGVSRVSVDLGLVEVGLGGVPDEVLEELVGVLVLDDQASGLDDVARVGDEFLAVGRELIHLDGRVGVDVAQSLVDLLVVRELAGAESLDDAIEAHLAVDIGGLGSSVGGVGDLD